jgi:hypothetical protein
MKKKKEEMVIKFEKLMKKGKLPNKDEFYRQIFPENFLGSLNLNDSNGFKEEENLYSDSNDVKESTNFKETFETQKVDNKNSIDLNTKQTSKLEDEEPIPTNNTKAQQMTYELDKEEEEEIKPSIEYLSLEQVMSLVTEKKEELNQNLLNLITANEVEEKRILESIKDEDSEEEKLEKMNIYERERAKNEEKLKEFKEYN